MLGGLLGLAVLVLGIYFGYRIFSPTPTVKTVNAQVILTALRERGFLVTQTYIFDQPIEIKKSTGSALKDFFVGQTITARGVMEVNMGTELANLSPQDIAITDGKITVSIPAAKVFNVRLVGPVDVKNNQGIIKRLLQNDDGYNEALAELSRVAEETANKPEFKDRATDRAKEEISRLLGYVAAEKTIEVTIK